MLLQLHLMSIANEINQMSKGQTYLLMCVRVRVRVCGTWIVINESQYLFNGRDILSLTPLQDSGQA